MKEVAVHCTVESCWMVVLDKVYDLTEFIEHHPGGYEIMLEYAGSDATNVFLEKPHTIEAHQMLEKYLLGELVKFFQVINFYKKKFIFFIILQKK